MADAELTTPGGLALNLDGTLADLPRDLAHHLSYQLMHVLTLLHSIRKEVPEGGSTDEADVDKFTSPSSRVVSLAAIADEKVRSVVKDLSPYV